MNKLIEKFFVIIFCIIILFRLFILKESNLFFSIATAIFILLYCIFVIKTKLHYLDFRLNAFCIYTVLTITGYISKNNNNMISLLIVSVIIIVLLVTTYFILKNQNNKS